MFDVEFTYLDREHYIFRGVYVSLIGGRLNIHFNDGEPTQSYSFTFIKSLKVRGCEY